MFAVLKTGGKQYRVQAGDVLRVEKLAAAAGEKVQFNDILMLGTTLGSPLIAGACVQAEVIDQIKGEKVIHFVKRRRKHSSQRTKGHRQQLTLLRVTDILGEGADATGVKAAIGNGSAVAAGVAPAPVASDNRRFAKNKADQSEMAARVRGGEAGEKSVEAEAPVAEAPVAAKPKRAAKAKAESAAPAPAGTRPANLLTEARGGQADDLKVISGVGPALEALLHKNGVYHFDQIAAWTQDEVDYMNSQLDFPGRIEREGWISQAGELAKAQKEA